MVKKTKEESEETRRKIVRAAGKVFEEKGYSATNLQNVAADAGVTRGAVYWHFPKGKPELFMAVLRPCHDKSQALMEKVFAGTENPLEKFMVFLRRVQRMIHDDPEYRRALILLATKWERTEEVEPYLQAMMTEGMGQVQTVVEVFVQGQKMGMFHPDIHPMVAFMLLNGAVNDTFRLWLYSPEMIPLTLLMDGMFDLWARGVCLPGVWKGWPKENINTEKETL
ncbi:MAG: TetR family transcriptional regulator [Deltaproteobacteria bacterium]|nr:TetR family transcriptional regulator [Deltaproteobacteria bacterium]